MDADTLLESHAIAAMRRSFAQEPALVAATGVLTPVCGPSLRGRFFQWFQTYEYVRNFLSRHAWMQLNGLLLISGAFAAFRRDALVNTHFAEPGVHMLRLREGGPEFKDPSQRIQRAAGEPVDLANFAPAKGAEYLWYIGREEPATMPPGAVVIYRTDRKSVV